MPQLRYALGRPIVIFISACIYIISQSAVGYILAPSNAGPALLEFQFSYTLDDFMLVFNRLSEAQLHSLRLHFYIELIHPLWYGILLFSIVSWLLKLNGSQHELNFLLYPVFLLVACDCVENIFHYNWLYQIGTPSDPWVFVAGFAATLKWALIFSYIFLIGLLAIRYLHQLFRQLR